MYPWKCKIPCLPSVTGFSSQLIFNLAEHSTLLYSGQATTVPGQVLNPGPLSLYASALLTEIMRPEGFSW